jgi:signal transduction histidine kinase
MAMVQVSAGPALLCRVLRDFRGEIVAHCARGFAERFPDVYRRRLREGYDSATFFEQDADLLLAYLAAAGQAERDGALERQRALRRELGRRCAAEGAIEPDALTGPPHVNEMTAEIVLQRYAQELAAAEVVQTLAMLHTHAVDMTKALLNGYLEYKEEVLADQRRTMSRLLDELTHVEGNERRSLALELHDGLAQQLVALSSGIQHCERLVERDPPVAHQELQRLGRVARETIGDVRALIRDLRFGVVGQGGGFAELGDYIADLETETGVRHDFQATGRISLPPAQEAQVIRIIQEALNNVYRHAAARNVEIRIAEEDGTLTVSVRDDGRGFDVATARAGAKQQHHFGLSGIQERAQFLGARLTVESTPGSGTVVRLHAGGSERNE